MATWNFLTKAQQGVLIIDGVTVTESDLDTSRARARLVDDDSKVRHGAELLEKLENTN